MKTSWNKKLMVGDTCFVTVGIALVGGGTIPQWCSGTVLDFDPSTPQPFTVRLSDGRTATAPVEHVLDPRTLPNLFVLSNKP